MTGHELEQAIGAWLLVSLAFCVLWAAVAAGVRRRSFTRHVRSTPTVVDTRRGRRARAGSR